MIGHLSHSSDELEDIGVIVQNDILRDVCVKLSLRITVNGFI